MPSLAKYGAQTGLVSLEPPDQRVIKCMSSSTTELPAALLDAAESASRILETAKERLRGVVIVIVVRRARFPTSFDLQMWEQQNS